MASARGGHLPTASNNYDTLDFGKKSARKALCRHTHTHTHPFEGDNWVRVGHILDLSMDWIGSGFEKLDPCLTLNWVQGRLQLVVTAGQVDSRVRD